MARVLDRSPAPILTDWSCAEFHADLRSLLNRLGDLWTDPSTPPVDQSVPIVLSHL